MSRRARSTNRWWLLTLVTVAACGGSPPDKVTQGKSALASVVDSGTLMPFGGQYGTYVGVVGSGLQVVDASAGGRTFVIDGPTIKTTSTPPKCLAGDLTAGSANVTDCTGNINQQWFFSGGQIVSADRSDGQDHCLDVFFAVTTLGTPLGLAPCNGTAAQVFWPVGYTMKIASTFSVTSGSPPVTQPECLDVLYDNESVGASLDDSVCNGTNAQWFTLDDNRHIALTNDQSLCLATGAFDGGLAPVSLATCAPGEDAQKWTFINQGIDAGKRRVASIANAVSGCLDILYGSPASPTTVDDFTCNSTPAQLWQPSPRTGVPYAPACGGSMHTACPDSEQFCERPSDTCATASAPDPIGSCTIMPVTCEGDFAPVCGCNGRTYANDCERQAAGSSKWYDGRCSSLSCPAAVPTPGTSCSPANISCVFYSNGGPCVQRLSCTNGVWSAPVVVCPS